MTREETSKLYAVMVIFYPECFRNNSVQEAAAWVNGWTDALSSCTYDQVSMAFKMYMQGANCKFPPKPGELIALINRTNPDHPDNGHSEADAWALVEKALRNSGYNAQEEFDRLPPEVREALGRADTLKTMALDENYYDHSGVYEATFVRSYRTIQERRRRDAQYSPDIVARIADARRVASEFSLPDGARDIDNRRKAQAEEAAQIRRDATSRKLGGMYTSDQVAGLLQKLADELGSNGDMETGH